MSNALVIGATGALGRTLCSTLFSSKSWERILTVGTAPWAGEKGGNSDERHQHIQVDVSSTAKQQFAAITHATKQMKFKAIYCVAGGFEMGSISSDPLVFIETSQSMIDKNVYSSLVATSIAMRHLDTNGLLVLTGSKSAMSPLSSMVQYGMTKNMVHYLTKSVGASKKFQGKIVAILPTTLDTEENRKDMPNADKSQWIPLDNLSDLLCNWGKDSSSLVSGGLYAVEMSGTPKKLATLLVSQ